MAITKASSSAVAPAAKGDLVVGNATNDSGVLGVGANNTVLTADSAEATGLKWATASSGGMTLLSTTTLSTGQVIISSIDQTYNNLQIIIQGITINSSATDVYVRPNAVDSTYAFQVNGTNGSGITTSVNISGSNSVDPTGGANAWCWTIVNYASSVYRKPFIISGRFVEFGAAKGFHAGGGHDAAAAITSIQINCGSGLTFAGGQVLIYGVK